MMKWMNTRESLPDEGKFVLIKIIQDDFTTYYVVSKRIGECFIAYGCKWLCVSSLLKIFWIYISDIENNMESCDKYETNKGSAKD